MVIIFSMGSFENRPKSPVAKWSLIDVRYDSCPSGVISVAGLAIRPTSGGLLAAALSSSSNPAKLPRSVGELPWRLPC